MSDQIKQIQATYLPIEDRILLQLKTEQTDNLQAWITRRYIKLLLPLLQGQHPETGQSFLKDEQLEQLLSIDSDHPPKVITSFEKDFPHVDTHQYELGDQPILLSKITFKESLEQPMLLLEPEEGSGLMLSYQPSLIKALMGLLQQTLNKSQWSIDESFVHQLPINTTLQ